MPRWNIVKVLVTKSFCGEQRSLTMLGQSCWTVHLYGGRRWFKFIFISSVGSSYLYFTSFFHFFHSPLNRNKNKESEATRRNIRRDVETPRPRTRSVSTSRPRAGRQSPDILFQSTPLYLPRNENVKTIEICINKREQTKQINRKQVNKKNTKQVSRKTLSREGIMSSGLSSREEEAEEEGGVGEMGEDVRIRPSRRDRGTGHSQYPRWDKGCNVICSRRWFTMWLKLY